MIVREYIEFKRPSGDLTAKDLGVGRRIRGKLFKYSDSHRPEYPTIYMFLEEEPKYHLYYYIGRFIDPRGSFTGYDFKFSENPSADGAWNAQSKKDDKMISLSPEEKEKLRIIISDPDNEDIIKRIERSSGVSRINESIGFQRGGKEADVKNKLFGFRPGQIVKREVPHKLGSELFVFLKWEDSRGSAINMQGYEIGYIIPPIYLIDSGKKQELKRPSRAIFSPHDYPILTNDIFLHSLDEKERDLVQKALDDPANKPHLKKAEEIITSKYKLFV